MKLLVLLSLFSLAQTGSRCPSNAEVYPCRCIYKDRNTRVYCRKDTTSKQINEVVKVLSERRMIIDLVEINSDNLKNIGPRFFGDAAVLFASFGTKALITVDKEAFDGQQYVMEDLEFHNTNLTMPPSMPLHYLQSLKKYALFKNPNITKIDSQFFASVPKTNVIEELDLSGNGITSIDLNIADHFPNLKHVYLENNELEENPNLKISNSSKLININLSQNLLNAISMKIMKNMPEGSKLNMRQNRVGNVYDEEIKIAKAKKITVNLMENELGCGCNMQWILNYTYSSNFPISGKCSSPDNMRRYHLRSLRKTSFKWCNTQ